MKERKPLTKLTLILAVFLSLAAARAQADILPDVTVSFSPVGLTMGQTARLNLLNTGVPNGMLVSWSFINANGNTLAQSSANLPLNKIVSVDFKRHEGPGEASGPLREEVRARVDIITPNVSSDSLRRSLEVFNSESGETTVFMGGGS